MTDEELDKLIAADDLGLTKPKPKRTPQTTEEERLLEGFQEIVRFVETTGAAPVELGAGMNERLLFTRLNAIRKNQTQCARLLPFDEYGLLKGDIAEPIREAPNPATIDDILNDPLFDSLEADVPDIFTIKHIPVAKDVDAPDYVAQRRPCQDFAVFEEQFQDCQNELRTGRRRLLPFANEQQIEVGKFYVLRGILLLVTEVGERLEKNGKWNARLRCIFENGTESDMLLRSLATELYKDGRRVTELEEQVLAGMVVDGDDVPTGYIYVLRSLSDHPDVKAVPNLHKIGLTRRNIDDRLRNAVNEPTYLLAQVTLVSTFKCYNLNLPKLESLLHRFFDGATARIQISDDLGNFYTPKEWFSVPIETIHMAVRLLLSGDIVNFRYDVASGEIVPSV